MRNNSIEALKHRRSKLTVWSILASVAGVFSAAVSASAENGAPEKKNHASVLIGGTHIPDADHTAFTLGIDLEHEITHRFGVGVVVEHAFDPIDATSLFGVVDVHLGHGFVLQAGPGVEWVEHKTYAVGRVGLFYEIEVGEIILAPTISYDISEAEDSIVFGVAIGTKF